MNWGGKEGEATYKSCANIDHRRTDVRRSPIRPIRVGEVGKVGVLELRLGSLEMLRDRVS